MSKSLFWDGADERTPHDLLSAGFYIHLYDKCNNAIDDCRSYAISLFTRDSSWLDLVARINRAAEGPTYPVRTYM